MATTFDIAGRINAAVSSGSLRMLKKLQTELRATAKALIGMGDKTTANALGHVAMALDRVGVATGKAVEGTKKVAESTAKMTKTAVKAAAVAEKSQGIYERVAEGYKLNAAEARGLYKAVERLGQKYGYATNMQKEWVPALKTSLNEIYKQKAALVASGKAISTHVSSQELFDRTNRKLASGLHKVSGTLTDYDVAMSKSLGRSPAFRNEVDKIAGAVGKQGESFKSQFAVLTKTDDLWRKHVTTLHQAGKVTTEQAQAMYDSYQHLGMFAKELQARIKSSNGELVNAATYNKAARVELDQHAKSMSILNRAEEKLATISGKSIEAIQRETEASMKRTRSFDATVAGINKQTKAYESMSKSQGEVARKEQTLAKVTGARIGKIQEITSRMIAQGASYEDVSKHLDVLKEKHAASVSQMGRVSKASDSLRKSNSQLADEIDALGRIRTKNLTSTQATVRSLEGLTRKYPQLSSQVSYLSTKVTSGNMSLATADKLLNRMRSGMSKTTKKASLLSRAMSSLVSHLKSFASYAAAASIIGGIASIFGLATRAIVKYDQALHDLQAITRATDDETTLMGERIREIGRTTKFSASEVATAMRTLGQAGFTASEAVSSIGAVANLATGTLTSMKTVVDLVTTAIRAFDLEATETGRVADVFANAVNRSKLTIDKLRIAFSYIGPIAAKAGVSFEETNTTMMMLANAGVRASTIGTGLRRTFQQLINPTEKLKAAMEAAGYTVEDFNPQFNAMRDVIRRLTEIVPDAESAFRLFSLRSASAVAALSSQGVAAFDSLNSSLLRSGSAAEMAEKQMEGLGIIFKQAWDNAHDLALAFGEAGVNGALRALGKGLKAVFVGLRKFVESGLFKAIVSIGAMTAAIYTLNSAWGKLKVSQWAITFVELSTTMGKTGAAVSMLGMTFDKLYAKIGPLLILVSALYAAYKLNESFMTKVNKVNEEYIDSLDDIHKKELERLENNKRLVSIARDELENNRKRSKALIDLQEAGIDLNLVVDEETESVENLSESLVDNVDALDGAASAFGDYKEKVGIEDLEAQVDLFRQTGSAIEDLIPKTNRLKAQTEGLFGEMVGKIEAIVDKIPLIGNSYESNAEKLEIYRKGIDALESQHGEAYEKMVTAVTGYGEITQEVWKDYMLQAGASEEEVADLFVDGEEKITKAHLEAYLRIQLARKDMTAAERGEIEQHIVLIGSLFDKVNNTVVKKLEKGLKFIREAYKEEEQVVIKTYDAELLALHGQIGYTQNAYADMVDIVKRKSDERLAILENSYAEQETLIKSYNLGMEEEQERLNEQAKKFANQRVALEKEVAEALRTLATEQLELLTESYKATTALYDESVNKKIDSVNRYYEFEKEKATAQLTDETANIKQRTANAKALAETLVELEVDKFNELVEIGEEATRDRLENEEKYNEEALDLIEDARKAAKVQFEEGSEERLKIEKDLNKKVVRISKASAEAKRDILQSWLDSLSSSYNEAVDNTRRYANKVISIENEIKDIRSKALASMVSVAASTEDQILRIRRAGMTDTQVMWSKVREARSKMEEADRLAATGATAESLTKAKKLYGEAQTIYADLGVKAATAAKEGKNIGIAHQEAERQVRLAGDGIVEVLEKERDASIATKEAELEVAKQAQRSWGDLARDIKGKIGSIKSDISELTGSVEGLVSSINDLDDKEVSIGADEARLNQSIKLVKGLWTNINKLKDKTITITTRHVGAKQAGGSVGLFARGGKLPGFGGGDKVKALLEAGEFIINKNSVKKYGTAIFEAYNNMATPVISAISKPLKFAFGGFVGMKPSGFIGMKPRGTTASSAIGDLSQIDGAISKLSKAVNALNLASSSLAVEGGSTRKRFGENSIAHGLRVREPEKTEGLDPEDYKISYPSVFKGLVGKLREDLKGVKGEDKTIIEEVIGLLTPSGISSKDVNSKLGGRKLPEATDIERVVLSLEEQKADLEERKEKLLEYLKDLEKVREFMAVANASVIEAEKLSASEEPYTMMLNNPNDDFEEILKGIKNRIIEAEPILTSSEFDTSEIKDKVLAYLEMQRDLVGKQIMNRTESGKCYGGEPMHLTQCVASFTERSTGIQRERPQAISDFTWPNFRLWAPLWETDLIEKSKEFNLEFKRFMKTKRLGFVAGKREVLKDQTDKYKIQSDLMSEADSIKQDLTYEPMKVPNIEPIQNAYEAFQASLGGISTSETKLATKKLKENYQKLAKKYFDDLPKFASGGFVDNILARLSPGEFVLKADAVKQVGVPFLNALNNFKFPVPAFAGGGYVEQAAGAPVKGTIPSVQRDIHLNVNITGAGEITEKQVRKWIYPAINKLQRLQG